MPYQALKPGTEAVAMNGVPLTLTLGLGVGASLGLLAGFPLVGAGLGMTVAVVLAAIVDVLLSSTRSGI